MGAPTRARYRPRPSVTSAASSSKLGTPSDGGSLARRTSGSSSRPGRGSQRPYSPHLHWRAAQGGRADSALSECWQQVSSVFEGAGAIDEHREVILAYEPVWAIGKSEPASAEHVIAVTKLIRKKVEQTGRSGIVRILYGGSAGPGLFDKLKDGVDGLFWAALHTTQRPFSRQSRRSAAVSARRIAIFNA
ncbi:hypothetical protein L7F22_059876 [Adiantum nelumboides]|nr:hypothetical protein [Adiantum nelumboides]